MEEAITQLIEASRAGDSVATQKLFTRVYAELKVIARKQQRRPGDSLNTTGLVHEAYLKLSTANSAVESRAHFMALAAKAMRQIVIDHARQKIAQKRGGLDIERVDAAHAESVESADLSPEALIRLDRALADLENEEPRLADLISMRFFAGMSLAEIAALQGVTERTLNRDWRRARAQIFQAVFSESV